MKKSEIKRIWLCIDNERIQTIPMFTMPDDVYIQDIIDQIDKDYYNDLKLKVITNSEIGVETIRYDNRNVYTKFDLKTVIRIYPENKIIRYSHLGTYDDYVNQVIYTMKQYRFNDNEIIEKQKELEDRYDPDNYSSIIRNIKISIEVI